jgi:very-short-patch-repair endonuclease
MARPPDPDKYFDRVLAYAEPGTAALRRPGPIEEWQQWWAKRATDPGPLPELAAGQGFVLTPEQLRTAGVSRDRARTRAARGIWSAAGRGAVSPFDLRDEDPYVEQRRRHAITAAAAALRHADHVVSGRSAAILRGVPTLSVPRTPELTDGEPAGLGRRRRAHIYGAAFTVSDVESWFGVPVMSLVRTLVDLGRHDRRDAIMAVDAALRERLVEPAELDAALAQAAGWPGVRRAREVLALGDGRAESALESLTRLALIDDGFPLPDLQVQIGPYRVDMLFGEARLVLEADGLAKYTDAEWRREKRREAALRRAGYRVERVTWEDVTRYWPATQARLREALRWRPTYRFPPEVWDLDAKNPTLQAGRRNG